MKEVLATWSPLGHNDFLSTRGAHGWLRGTVALEPPRSPNLICTPHETLPEDAADAKNRATFPNQTAMSLAAAVTWNITQLSYNGLIGGRIPHTPTSTKLGKRACIVRNIGRGQPGLQKRRSIVARPAPHLVAFDKFVRNNMWESRERALPDGHMATAPLLEPTEPHITPEAVDSEPVPQFDWSNRWYPVSPVDDMDPTVPYPFQILGRKVVFWYSGPSEGWVCLEDRCPHRLAPLSEGRIDPATSCLHCSYHGWAFRADGTCGGIPQDAGGKAAANPRTTVGSLPVTVAQGLLYVWGDMDSDHEARRTPPPITPGMDEEGWAATGTFRDMSYGWDTAMENLVDPSHVCVAHHAVNGGVMGRRSDAKPLPLSVVGGGPTAEGFRGEMEKEEGATTQHVFQAPSRFTYDFEAKKSKGGRGIVSTYCTPMAPGLSRILVVNARNFFLLLSSGPRSNQLMPRWVEHQLMLNLLDGDLVLLHRQERELCELGGSDKWQSSFFMPTLADRYVRAFRGWLHRFGGGEPGWVSGTDTSLPPLITDKKKLLDRYTQHTKYCVACSGALAKFQKAQRIFYCVALAFISGALVVSSTRDSIVMVALAAVSGLLGWYMSGWIRSFYYKGYDHARMP